MLVRHVLTALVSQDLWNVLSSRGMEWSDVDRKMMHQVAECQQ